MKGGGLKDSREGALCDSGSLAGDLAEECSTAEKKIMMHDHERKSRQQAHGRRFTPCRKLPGRDSFPQRADARGSTGQPTLSPGSQGRDMCGDKSRVSPAVSNTKDAAGLEGPTQLRRVGKHRPLPYTRRTSAIGSAVSRATCTTQGCAGYLLPYGGDADPWRGARGPPRRLWHADEVASGLPVHLDEHPDEHLHYHGSHWYADLLFIGMSVFFIGYGIAVVATSQLSSSTSDG